MRKWNRWDKYMTFVEKMDFVSDLEKFFDESDLVKNLPKDREEELKSLNDRLFRWGSELSRLGQTHYPFDKYDFEKDKEKDKKKR